MSMIWHVAPTRSDGLEMTIAPNALEQLRAARIARYHRLKLLPDRICALALLVPGLPLIGFLVLLIRFSSRGAAVYSQCRVGKDGRLYTMYKLRSMCNDAEANSGPAWSIEDDPRVTHIGRWLRKLHLDELPQLFNVLRGDMSLIGPRPERPEFVEVLAQEIPHYLERMAVLPGVTGLAQINLPADTNLDCVRRKLVLDREYVADANFWLDIRIFLCTVLRIVGLSGQRAMRATRLQRTVVLPPAPVATAVVAPIAAVSLAPAPHAAFPGTQEMIAAMEAPPVVPPPANDVAVESSTEPPRPGSSPHSIQNFNPPVQEDPLSVLTPLTVSYLVGHLQDSVLEAEGKPELELKPEPPRTARRSSSDSGILGVGAGRPS